MVWTQYRKTIVPVQLFVVTATVTLYFSTGRQWFPALMIFLVMQAGALLSAAWTVRTNRQAERRDQELPLNRRW